MEDAEVEKHGSFGVIRISRSSGGHASLFGSSIKHHERVTIAVCRAERIRDLSYDRFHGREELIEIDMSPVQFAEAITHMNCGDGTPCTLRYVMGERQPDCPEYTQREKFEKEFKRDVLKATKKVAEIRAAIRDKLTAKGPLSVADRKELAGKIESLLGGIEGSLPFVQSQFNEAMEKTVSECKGEVEAFVTNKVHRLGLEALAEMMPRLPSVKEPKRIQSPTPTTRRSDEKEQDGSCSQRPRAEV